MKRNDILTCSGFYFDYLKGNNFITRYDIARALSRICRFGGHLRDGIEFYSVAQHSVQVSMIVEHMGSPEHALRALWHDAAEAYVCDIMRPLKNLLPDYKAIEKDVERQVMDALGFEGPMPACIKEADIICLATEQRDLVAKHDDDWVITAGIKPASWTINPLLPNEAFSSFIDHYARLTNQDLPCIEFAQAVTA